MNTKDYFEVFCDGIAEEIGKRWPEFNQHKGKRLMTGTGEPGCTAYSELQLTMSDECAYNYIHIMCGEDIFIDADGDYGPSMIFNYEDPDCVENVLAFILAVKSTKRKPGPRFWLAGETIHLTEWRIKLTQKEIVPGHWLTEKENHNV